MRLTVLGSGGNTPIPTPTCSCEVCGQARDEGIPYARGGNSLYLHDLSAMVDAPESAFRALNRERIESLEYVFLTHWHPDHVNGLRVVQSRDVTAHDGLLSAIADGGPTLVTTEPVFDRIRDVFGQVDHFTRLGFADVTLVDDAVDLDGTTVRAIPYALDGEEPDATAFVLDDGVTTTVIASDDARSLDETALPSTIDLAVLECGLFEDDPAGGQLLTEADWEFLADELTHGEVLDRIARVEPDRTLLTEIEHLTARSHDHFVELSESPAYEGIQFARDGLTLTVGE